MDVLSFTLCQVFYFQAKFEEVPLRQSQCQILPWVRIAVPSTYLWLAPPFDPQVTTLDQISKYTWGNMTERRKSSPRRGTSWAGKPLPRSPSGRRSFSPPALLSSRVCRELVLPVLPWQPGRATLSQTRKCSFSETPLHLLVLRASGQRLAGSSLGYMNGEAEREGRTTAPAHFEWAWINHTQVSLWVI